MSERRNAMVLDKKSFMDTVKLATEEVEIKEGKTVIVSEIGAQDYIKLWTQCSDETGEIDEKGNKKTKINMTKFTPALVCYSIIDPETGDRMFADDEIHIIARLPQSDFTKIAEVANKLNGLAGDEKIVSTPIQEENNGGELQLPLDTGIQTN